MTGTTQQSLNAHGSVHKSLLTVRNNALSCSIIISALLLFSILFTSCKHSPVENILSPELTMEETTCTEIWYRLKANGYKLPILTEVYANQRLTNSFSVTTPEKIFYIEGLLPKQTYQITVMLSDASGKKTVLHQNIVTMDTTSHDIVWQDYTFGDIPTSYFRDVTITQSGKIIAVGLLSCYAPPDTNVTHISYNLIESTSNGWERRQEKFYDFKGSTSRDAYDAYSVCEYLPDKLLISIPGQVMYRDGTQLPPLEFIDDWITSYWKSSGGEIWGAGKQGGIEHYNGTTWEYLKTNSTVPLNSISGSDETGIIWASGYNQLGRSAVFKVQNNKASEYWSDGKEKLPMQSKDWIIASCVIGRELYLVSGAIDRLSKISLLDSTIYRYEYENSEYGKMLFKLRSFVEDIKALAKNDIFIVCHFGLIYHYNGYSWKRIEQFFNPETSSKFVSVCVTKKIIAIVGQIGYNAYLVTGTR